MEQHIPPVGFHFRVDFGLKNVTDSEIRFHEVSGLNAEIAVETLDEGGENRFSHRLPGRAKFPNLVLKRGLVSDSMLLRWFQDAIEHLEVLPTTVRVSLVNERDEPLTTWAFVDAWPVKWNVSGLDATKNALAVDTIELAYRYFTRI